MSRTATVVIAVLLVIGSSGISASAFARGGDHSGGDHFRDSHFSSGFRDTSHDRYGGYGNRAGGLSGGFRGYGGRDVWGHWGAYYGPMIPTL